MGEPVPELMAPALRVCLTMGLLLVFSACKVPTTTRYPPPPPPSSDATFGTEQDGLPKDVIASNPDQRTKTIGVEEQFKAPGGQGPAGGASSAPEWVKFGAGKFTMGQPDGGEGIPAALAAHVVATAPFAMGKTEVTVAKFNECVAAGACPERPRAEGCFAQEEMPANCLTWPAASAVCRWQGGRLPTEVEWEFAARGPEGRIYPWGDAWHATDDPALHSAHAVGTYSHTDTPEGLHDMGGNVREWTSTPSATGFHVSKSMMCTEAACLTYNRFPNERDDATHAYLGARCVKAFDAVPGEAASLRPFVNRVGPRNLHWAMFTDGVVVLQLPDPLRNLPRIVCWVSARIAPNGRAETPDTTHEGVAFTSCPKPLVAHAVKAVRDHRFQTSTTEIVSVLPVLLGDPKVNMTPRLNAQLFPPDTPEGVVKRETAQGGPSSGCTVAVRVHPDGVPQVFGATQCTETSARAAEAAARNWRWRKTATSREGIIRVLFSATRGE